MDPIAAQAETGKYEKRTSYLHRIFHGNLYREDMEVQVWK